jgi:hypothetical protein
MVDIQRGPVHLYRDPFESFEYRFLMSFSEISRLFGEHLTSIFDPILLATSHQVRQIDLILPNVDPRPLKLSLVNDVESY